MNKIYAFCDLSLVIATVILAIIMQVLCVWGIVAAPCYTIASGVFAVRCIWSVLLIGFYWGMVLISKDVLTFVMFDDECVTLWIPFAGIQKIKYSRYAHIYTLKYFHGSVLGLGSQMPYVVFSQKYLSDKNLMDINQLANSSQTFKIRMRRKRFDELLKLLPPRQAKMLQSAMRK